MRTTVTRYQVAKYERARMGGQAGREERGGEGGRKGERAEERREAGRRKGLRKAFATAVPLIARSTAVQKLISSNLFHLKIELINNFSAGLGRAIAAARPVTPFGMLAVNSDSSTHRAPDEVWIGP